MRDFIITQIKWYNIKTANKEVTAQFDKSFQDKNGRDQYQITFFWHPLSWLSIQRRNQ